MHRVQDTVQDASRFHLSQCIEPCVQHKDLNAKLIDDNDFISFFFFFSLMLDDDIYI